MKNLIIVFALLLSVSCFGQIKINEDTEKTIGKYAQLELSEKFLSKYNLTYFRLMYRDERYRSITEYESIRFDNADELKQFYDLLKETSKTRKEVSFDMGDQSISFLITSSKEIMVSVYESGYFTIPNTQIDKLFGK